MLVALLLFGGVALFGVAATLVQLGRDGYRRAPIRRYRTLP